MKCNWTSSGKQTLPCVPLYRFEGYKRYEWEDLAEPKSKLFSLPCILPGESLEQMPGFNVKFVLSLCSRKLPGAQLQSNKSVQCHRYQQQVFVEKSSKLFSKYVSRQLAGSWSTSWCCPADWHRTEFRMTRVEPLAVLWTCTLWPWVKVLLSHPAWC